MNAKGQPATTASRAGSAGAWPPRGLLIDLDGVVYEGDRVLPGAPAFFRFLRDRALPFLLITNNSTLRPSEYVAKLARMEIEVAPSEVLGSAEATADYLRSHAPPGARVYVIGEGGLTSAIANAGFELVESDVEYVVVGLDRELDYRKLTLAVRLVRAGACFIGPNPDTTLPMPEGVIPGAGSFQALIHAATGVRATVIGKPEPTMFLMGAERLGLPPSQVAMVGDRLDTDIVGAKRAGVTALMVLTGVSRAEDIAHSPEKPDRVYTGLADVQTAIASAL